MLPQKRVQTGKDITWDHSPGAAWNAHAEEKGWLKEMNLQVQICEGDDMKLLFYRNTTSSPS